MSTPTVNEPTNASLKDAPQISGRLSQLLQSFLGQVANLRAFLWAPTNRLTASQRVLLEQRRLLELSRRSTIWVSTLMFACVMILCFVGSAAAPMFGFTKWVWALGLLTLLVCQVYFAQWLERSMDGLPAIKLRRVHLLMCAWITLIALWWMVGAWTLPSPQRPFVPGRFVFSNFTFMLLTLSGQALTLLLLAPSLRAIASAIFIGFSIPYICYRLFHPSQSGGFSSIYWTMSQVTVYFIIGIFVASEFKRSRIRELLLEAERARANHFVAAISHDLRQPLTAIMFRLKGLESKAVSPEVLNDIRTISQQTISIESMVNGTLDLSRLESGTWSVSKRDVSLPTLLDSISSDLEPEAALRHVEFTVQSEPYLVRTDPVAFGRIIRNLVGNALRYTPGTADRPGHVQLRCEVQGNRVRVSVIDDGIGIPTTRIDDIFKEYVQLANPERDHRKGLGLGLSIVKGLAQLLGHELDLESAEGVGSRFSVYVPISAEIPPELLMAAEPSAEAKAPKLNGMLVALVEDNEDARVAMREHLQRWDCEVIDGESADELIQALAVDGQMKRPDFILSDYRLRNGRTGVEAIAALRKALSDTVPAAIWTAETTPVALHDIAKAGLPRLSKPPELLFLASLLTKHSPQRVQG
jgi:two-component system, sensor histidine kinase